jgi:hypothetical protein
LTPFAANNIIKLKAKSDAHISKEKDKNGLKQAVSLLDAWHTIFSPKPLNILSSDIRYSRFVLKEVQSISVVPQADRPFKSHRYRVLFLTIGKLIPTARIKFTAPLECKKRLVAYLAIKKQGGALILKRALREWGAGKIRSKYPRLSI